METFKRPEPDKQPQVPPPTDGWSIKQADDTWLPEGRRGTGPAKQTAHQPRLSAGSAALYHLPTEYRAGGTWPSDQPVPAID